MANALSREQVADALYKAGFRGQDLVNMVAIAGRESGYQPAAHRSDQPKSKLSGDLGLFQINYSNWPTISKTLGLTSKRQLFDPVVNAKAAKVLFDSGGYRPWAAGPNGWAADGDPFYKTNRNAAASAVNNYLQNPNQHRVSSGNTATTNGGASSNSGVARNPSKVEAPNLMSDIPQRKPIPDYKPPAVDPDSQQGLTTLLEGFGIDYPTAPRATPQLLAFLRGLGAKVDAVEDQYDTAIENLNERRSNSMSDLQLSDQRRRRSIANDAVRRGALTSGATNTTYSQHSENVANKQADIQRAYAESNDAAQATYDNAMGSYRQNALERVVDEETKQEEYDKRMQAEVEALRRQQEENDLAYQRTMEAQQRAANAQAAMYNNAYR